MTFKAFHYAVNLLFVLACLVHFCYIGYYVVYPEFPTINVYRTDLMDIDFPIAFRFCINEPKDGSLRFKSVGYKKFTYLFYGESMHKTKMFGWRGHFQNGSTFNSVEGRILVSFNIILLCFTF